MLGAVSSWRLSDAGRRTRGGRQHVHKESIRNTAFPAPAGAVFQTGFHFVVGLAMALFYAFVLEPWMRAPSWLRGVLFATAVWLIQQIAIVLDTLNRSLGSSESNGRGRRAVCWRPFDVYFAAAADSATQAAASRPGGFLLRSSVARARRPARLSIRSLLRPGVGRWGLRRFGERFRDELANGITTRLLRLGRK